MDFLGRVAERVLTAILEISASVASFGSQELVLIGGAVLVAFLGYRLVLRRR